ncbi:hypothetical protein BMETH_23_2 [methanotrophic bacterial endosymbiont of Bathymodiolus sp.]|nr:hypothetical protein BMETH_23_2 [methanotrophic bacterial endosymbiont of Bathymodiolus sp.]
MDTLSMMMASSFLMVLIRMKARHCSDKMSAGLNAAFSS